MTKEQKFFIENVKIIFSPQEKQGKNQHILNKLNSYKVKYEKIYAPNNLKEGDYSFVILGKDYRNDFLIERKYGLEELQKCLGEENKETKSKKRLKELHKSLGVEKLRDNLEAEFARMLKNKVCEKWLFIENCRNFEEIRSWKSGFGKNKEFAGKMIYTTLLSWSCENRYGFKICCLENKNDFARVMILKMFYFWRNCMKKEYGDNFLSKIKEINENN